MILLVIINKIVIYLTYIRVEGLTMFGRKKDNKNIDYPKLNEVIKLLRDILKIVLALGIVTLIVLGYFLLREWKIFNILGTILSILSPLFIGIVIAWLLDPLVTKR